MRNHPAGGRASALGGPGREGADQGGGAAQAGGAGLHRAIQVLFGWDGDHLHSFTVADVRYSDPLFDLEETADEEAVRLRDAFPASVGKPVRCEYDFGAGWVHEVTRTSSSRVGPGEVVPRYLSFSGDNPVEYWNEDELANPGPFNMAKVNAALAD